MEEQEEAVRWNIKVSKETDLTLRTFLGAHGMKKGDLSKFIEEAARWRVSTKPRGLFPRAILLHCSHESQKTVGVQTTNPLTACGAEVAMG